MIGIHVKSFCLDNIQQAPVLDFIMAHNVSSLNKTMGKYEKVRQYNYLFCCLSIRKRICSTRFPEGNEMITITKNVVQ